MSSPLSGILQALEAVQSSRLNTSQTVKWNLQTQPEGLLDSPVYPLQVPYRLLKAFQKVHPRLVRELEKKFSGKDVVLVANRRIQPKPSTGMAKARPRSRTLTSVRARRAACAVLPLHPG